MSAMSAPCPHAHMPLCRCCMLSRDSVASKLKELHAKEESYWIDPKTNQKVYNNKETFEQGTNRRRVARVCAYDTAATRHHAPLFGGYRVLCIVMRRLDCMSS